MFLLLEVWQGLSGTQQLMAAIGAIIPAIYLYAAIKAAFG